MSRSTKSILVSDFFTAAMDLSYVSRINIKPIIINHDNIYIIQCHSTLKTTISSVRVLHITAISTEGLV